MSAPPAPVRAAPPPSAPAPATRAMRRRGLLGWGVVLIVAWAAAGLPAQLLLRPYGGARPGAYGATVLLLGAVLVAGIICTVLGIRAERRAARVERCDRGVALAVQAALAGLEARPPQIAYEADVAGVVLEGARLVDLDDAVDSDLVSAAVTALAESTQEFGSTLQAAYAAARAGWVDDAASAGTTAVVQALAALPLGSSVQPEMFEGGTSMVFEAAGPAGERDTYRVLIAPSRGMVAWLRALLDAVADEVGGERTHAGAATATGGQRLAAHVAPHDTRYATDRLHALRQRPFADRDPLDVAGVAIGRNALLATTIAVSGRATAVNVLPARFPALLGEALAAALSGLARTSS